MATSPIKWWMKELNHLHYALALLLICAAPNPAALEGEAKVTIQAIRAFTHHAISVFFELYRPFVGVQTNRVAESLTGIAWANTNWVIQFFQKAQYEDDEFLPDLVDGLESLIAQDAKGIEWLHSPNLYDHREWFREMKCELDKRRKVCCLALLPTSHECGC